MVKNPYQSITQLLKKHTIPYQEIDHEPVFTSEQAAKVRGLSIKEGAKSLLLKCDGIFILAIIPSDRKLDSKKVKKLLTVKDIRFATPDEVKEQMGCEIGACYPFGQVAQVTTFVDVHFEENEFISCNPGVHDKSIRMKWEDYKRLAAPQLVDMIKN